MPRPLEVLLLVSLPGSGKSEILRYLRDLGPEQCRAEFGLGPLVALNDYPYVHLMRRISQESQKLGLSGIFFDANELPMKEPFDWGVLVELLNEDYADLTARRRAMPTSAAEWLFARLDAARAKVGAGPAVGGLPAEQRAKLAAALEADAAALVKERNDRFSAAPADRTVVVEFSRGGKDGSAMPLPAPFGYGYSLAVLADAILSKASVLYVWVTADESRRRNRLRAGPANLFTLHQVPLPVMMVDYGCDDLEHLLKHSDRPDTLKVVSRGRTFYLPAIRLDNRKDRTSFLRGPREGWPEADTKALHAALCESFGKLHKAQVRR
ncbi:MAG TPA: hypothetical protein VGK67_39635 [Myxococcales bacterium]|jgi:hypothetical protein